MSVSVDWIVGATTYALSGRNPYGFISLTGLGLPPVRRITERGPQQHGSTDVGFLLDERMLNLALIITGDTLSDLDTYRDDLADMLKPLEATPGKLRVTRDNGTVRQIDSNIVGMVDFPNTLQERIGASQLVVVQFMAPDPIPYEPTLNNIILGVTLGSGGLLVPMVVPMVYTVAASIDTVVSVTYAGKWEVFPIIYITGPANDLVITNQATGRKLDFTGHNIASGDTYTINLAYGQKSVRDQNNVLKNAALTDDSNLTNWSLVPTPTAPGGINDIRVEVSGGGAAATRIRMEYYDRYPSMG